MDGTLSKMITTHGTKDNSKLTMTSYYGNGVNKNELEWA